MDQLAVKEVMPLRWEIVEGTYSEIISDMSLEEFRNLPADDPRRKGKKEVVMPSEVEISGINIPITSHAPMGMLFSAIKERVNKMYRVSYCMIMLNRRQEATDPFRIQILVDNSPVDGLKDKVNKMIEKENAKYKAAWKEAVKRGEKSEDEKPETVSSEEKARRYEAASRLYCEECVKHYPELLALFKAALEAFAKDDRGLKWYREYVTTTTDSLQKQDDKVKTMRDKVLVKADLMSVGRASKKREVREAKESARERHEFEMQLVETLTSKDYIDDEVMEIAEQLGIPEKDLPRVFEASRTHKPATVYNMIIRIAAAAMV
ncbi:MAG: hypothetical protein Q4E47_00095 [Candidatus Saccharibacteria bacterium]|nr:hypothetical protein [Candidatus Saccharibacteria bacterium]